MGYCMITLKKVLTLNAASCIFFGLIFLLFPIKITNFLASNGHMLEMVLMVIGAILFVNGCHLLWASFQSSITKYLIWYFSIGDFIWVLFSLALLITGIWVNTIVGVIAAILVAVMVGTLGALQLIKQNTDN